MEIVYYYHKPLKVCPVREYFKEYSLNIDDTEKIQRRKQKILGNIDAKIMIIQENEGRPVPPISIPIHEYSFFEIKNPKDENTVIRILYFRYENKIVLLHAFEKPSNYDDRKTKKNLDKEYKIGEKYLNIFKLKSTNYEKYQQTKNKY